LGVSDVGFFPKRYGCRQHLLGLMAHAVMDTVAADRLQTTSRAALGLTHAEGVEIAVGQRALLNQLATSGVAVPAAGADGLVWAERGVVEVPYVIGDFVEWDSVVVVED